MSNFVSQEWLKAHLDDPNLVIVDCRFNLGNPREGEALYQAGHIPNAVYFDLERDMSSKVETHGGRHPLPNIDDFVNKLSEVGISSSTMVVAYDDQEGAMAARFWWLLSYLGHRHVTVLNEGYSTWEANGYPISQKAPIQQAKHFQAEPQEHMIITMDNLKEQLASNDGLVIDSRSPERYKGESEPIDKKAGHIPGAVNWFWKDNLQAGQWLSKQQLNERFQVLKHVPRISVYCGSGVTACANLLALHEAGILNARLYPGSWSDWISYDENPIEKEVETNG